MSVIVLSVKQGRSVLDSIIEDRQKKLMVSENHSPFKTGKRENIIPVAKSSYFQTAVFLKWY